MKKWNVQLDFGNIQDSPGLRRQCEEYELRGIEVIHHYDGLRQLRVERSALDIHDAAHVAINVVKAGGALLIARGKAVGVRTAVHH